MRFDTPIMGKTSPTRPASDKRAPVRTASAGVHKKLLKMLGASQVRMDTESLKAASLDNLRLSFLPDAVLFPEDHEAISKILILANSEHVPVTVRGAGSSTTGSAAPIKGGWVLDFSRWNKVKIDAVAGIAYAQPGATIATINEAAEKKGWLYPPDPSSHKYATIGGTIACNAGGMRGAKYGVTRDYILGLEGFLPTGEFVRWGADLRKFAAGYNLRDLWIGSEGMLGLITGAVLKLVPKPQSRATLLATFKNEALALNAVKVILTRRIVPSVLEFLDRQTVECTLRAEAMKGENLLAALLHTATPKEAPALLLIELDGHPAQVAEDKEMLRRSVITGALSLVEAHTAAEVEHLWAIRRRCSKAMFQMGDSKLNEDVVVPLRAQKELLRYTLQLKKETGLATPTFGHAADGNFHVHLMYNREDAVQRKAAEQGVQLLMEKVVSLGGAITGEHGIGLAKSAFLHLQHGKAEIETMKRIKTALDPNGILNPGKLFHPFPVWEHTPVKVELPWDHH